MTDIVWQSVVIQTISFLIFVFLLSKILFEPVMSVIAKRTNRVEDLTGAAQDAEEKTKALQTTLQRRFDDARLEAGQVMDNLRIEAEGKRDQIVAEMRSKVQELREENAAKLKSEMDSALTALEPHVKELGRMIAEKAINRELAG